MWFLDVFGFDSIAEPHHGLPVARPGVDTVSDGSPGTPGQQRLRS
jgi:hypothetical protein